VSKDGRQHRVDIQERLVTKFLLLADVPQHALNIVGCTGRESESANARLNVFRVQIEAALIGGRLQALSCVRQVDRLGVLLQSQMRIGSLA